MNVVSRHLRRDMIDNARLAQAEQEIRRAAPIALVKAEHRCEFCGHFENAELLRQISLSSGSSKLKSHLDIIPLDGDVTNTEVDNLGVACGFCAPILSLNAISPGQVWHLAWMPGYEQAWISLLSSAIMHSNRLLLEYERTIEEGGVMGGPTMKSYQTMLESLRPKLKNEFRSAVVTAKSLLAFENLTEFADALERMGHEAQGQFQHRAKYLEGFVVIPDGLITNNWTGFDNVLTAITEASPFASLRSLLDLAALGRQSFQIAVERGWPPRESEANS